jgi:hypothetical protein
LPLTPQGIFSFLHANQSDTPNVAASVLKGEWDAQANELKTTLNSLITALEKTTATSGAEQIGSLAIASLTGTTIRAQLLSLRDQLKSITDGSSGADFIAATAIAGLTGGTVQALLEALKAYSDLKDTDQTNALTTHKSSSDHDGRYFTETELQSITDGSSGADKTGATQVSPGSGTTVQAIVEWLYLQITSATLGQIPDGSITPAKLSFDPATQAELDALSTTINTALGLKASIASLNAHLADYSLQVPYAAAAGPVNVYTATLAPALAAYVAGVALAVNINITNTGAATINVNGLGAKAIKDSKGNAMTAGKLRATSIYTLRYNGTDFILQGEGGGGNAIAAHILAGETATVDSGDIVGTMPIRSNGAEASIYADGAGVFWAGFPTGAYLSDSFFGVGIASVKSTDADFIAANLIKDMVMLGLTGTGTNAKRKATGSGTGPGAILSVTGLAFAPAKVIVNAWHGGGTTEGWIHNISSSSDLLNVVANNSSYTSNVFSKNTNSVYSLAIVSGAVTNSSGFTTNMTYAADMAYTWIAYE